MKVAVATVLVLTALASASAYPRFLAIPLDGEADIALLEEAGAAARAPRAAPALPEEAARVERGAHHHLGGGGGGGGDGGHHHGDYVDFGAHTGHHGAFGWYADFPVITHGH
ncbi:uncharacterized protein LOC126148531 [Schistocerca cancellata]|uniref:uncharacterized protein LOC126148531 n=1 Tax=Schistocerca cancellata TaxID=274614 RepID=UPI00211842F4|nr:uncharacterized protein LOC126148531 [Schistocerca cancellata]